MSDLLTLPPACAGDAIVHSHLLALRLAIAELEAAESELSERLARRRTARIVERFRENLIEPLGRG